MNGNTLARKKLKLLLLQLREDKETMQEEHESFSKFSELSQLQIDVLNVFQLPKFSAEIIHPYDGLFIGGSSSVTVLQPKKYPFIQNCVNLIRYCIDIDFPVFASCFGHQLATIALGGKVYKHNGKDFEKGTVAINLTPLAKNDILYGDVSNGFSAVSVHKEYTNKIPNGCDLLAYTDMCHHSYKVKNKRFWTFQFHPEVDKGILIRRLSVYRTQYADSDEELQAIFDNTSETPESNNLLKKFVDRVVLVNRHP